jgi:hypothetical protein
MFNLLTADGTIFRNVCINWGNLSTRRAQVMSGWYYNQPCNRTVVGKYYGSTPYNIPSDVEMKPFNGLF